MMTTPLQRRILLGGFAAAAVAVTVVSGESPVRDGRRESAQPAAPVEARSARLAESTGPPVPQVELARLARAPAGADGEDLFAPKSWKPPRRAPPRVEQPAAVPVAPPLPFTYVGQMEGREGMLAYLSRDNEFLAVKPGDVFGDYRLESVSPEAVVLTYLPLGEEQSLLAVAQ